MSNLNVLIVGASIAGPTAAYWFARVGAHVTVIERFPELRKGGQNIDIRTVGVNVMRRMPGMEAAVRAKTTQMEGICLVNNDGRPFATMTSTGDADQQSLVSEFEIFRGDLAQILYDFTKNSDRITYQFGEQIASLQHDSDGPITVEFANGFPRAQYDLVVACDGATSRTRAMGFGCSVRDHIIRLNGWAAYFSLRESLLHGSKMGHGFSRTGGRFLAVGPNPEGPERACLMKHYSNSDEDATLPFRDASAQGIESLKQYVRNAYEGGGWKTAEILNSMILTDDFYASEIVQVKTPRLSNGRLVLVGDAGYASGYTGSGTSLALAGAYLLAGEIGSHPDDLAAGLKGYEERMKPIVDDLQKIPPGVTTLMAPQTAWGLRLRNLLFMFVSWASALSASFLWITKIFGGLFASSFGKDKYGIPDYEWLDLKSDKRRGQSKALESSVSEISGSSS
ncbi:MAG: hypothetical protein Q9162_004345 [Coniocarpon cinnabarinum]